MARQPDYLWLFIVAVVSLPFLSVEIYLVANICSYLGLLLSVFVHSSLLRNTRYRTDRFQWRAQSSPYFLVSTYTCKCATDLQIFWTIRKKTDKNYGVFPLASDFSLFPLDYAWILPRHQSIINAGRPFSVFMEIIHGFFSTSHDYSSLKSFSWCIL